MSQGKSAHSHVHFLDLKGKIQIEFMYSPYSTSEHGQVERSVPALHLWNSVLPPEKFTVIQGTSRNHPQFPWPTLSPRVLMLGTRLVLKWVKGPCSSSWKWTWSLLSQNSWIPSTQSNLNLGTRWSMLPWSSFLFTPWLEGWALWRGRPEGRQPEQGLCSPGLKAVPVPDSVLLTVCFSF
jgi:hypothetical protein